MRILSIIILSLFLLSCNKPDPNPELKDPIYSDLQARFGAKKQEAEAEKKKLEGFRAELKEVIPQSGQIKWAQKRVNESAARLAKLQQEAQYLELKIVARKKEAIASYKAAFAQGEEWPNPKEFENYELEKKLRNIKPEWDSRARVKELSGDRKTASSEEKPATTGH